jgi:ferredoxin
MLPSGGRHGSMASIERKLGDELASSGLVPRGAFRLEAGEGPDGFQSGVLIGHLGGVFWPVFKAWHDEHPDVADPMDAWSKEVISDAARAIGGRAFFPSNKPYLPFQRWAMRAEGLKPAPFGILMHPIVGSWHAYRGVVLFERSFDYSAPAAAAHPCDTCADKPCLTTCPVNAVSPVRFDVSICRSHLASPEGAPCMTQGCLVRNACPAGAEFRYSEAQQAFHQRAFRGV